MSMALLLVALSAVIGCLGASRTMAISGGQRLLAATTVTV